MFKDYECLLRYKRSKTLKCQAICIFLHDFFSKAFFFYNCWKMKMFFRAEFFFIFTVKKAPGFFFFKSKKKKQRKGENWLYWLLTCFSDGYYTVDLMCIPLQYLGQNILNYGPFGKIQLFFMVWCKEYFCYSCYCAAVSLSDVVVVHSKRKKVHWPLKRGKVFQVTLLFFGAAAQRA